MIDSPLTEDRPPERLKSPDPRPTPPIRPTDGERLMRFCRHRDQAALTEVIELHAPMVWGVCSQVLRHREDVEDAFQATFLILARKAKAIRAADSAAGWLYRVAFRTALLARNRRNRTAMQPLVEEPASEFDQLEAITRNEQCRVLLEELYALPLQYREPLVLCYLEGRSRSEVADELGVTPQSVKGRLARGTRLLRSRMVTRGTALSTTMAVVTAAMASAQAQAAPALILKTAALGIGFATKLSAAGATATAMKGSAALLAEKGILAMTVAAAAKPGVAILGACLIAGMFTVATAEGPQGDGAGGAPVVLLAESDVDADASSEETADVNPVAGEEEESEVELEVLRAADEEATLAGEAPLKPVTVEVRAATELPGVEEIRITTQAAPVPTKSAAPSDVLLADSLLAITKPLPPGGAPSFGIRAPAPVDQFQMFTDVSLPRTERSSEKLLKLEQEYWEIKSRALRTKAEALQRKSKRLKDSGTGSDAEVLEAQAEGELALAEVKLCEVNTQRLKEAMEAAEAGKIKRGAKGVQVSMLQQLLNDRLKPSPKLDVDADFGTLTEQAVTRFQKANGLQATGAVDEKTWAALGGAGLSDVVRPRTPSTFEFGFQPELHVQEMEARAKMAAQEAQAAAQGMARKAIEARQAATARERKIAAAGSRYGGEEPAIMHTEALKELSMQLEQLRAANQELRSQLDELRESHEEGSRGR